MSTDCQPPPWGEDATSSVLDRCLKCLLALEGGMSGVREVIQDHEGKIFKYHTNSGDHSALVPLFMIGV